MRAPRRNNINKIYDPCVGRGGRVPTKMVGNPPKSAEGGGFWTGTIARTIGHCDPTKLWYVHGYLISLTHGATAKNIELHPHEPRPLFRVVRALHAPPAQETREWTEHECS